MVPLWKEWGQNSRVTQHKERSRCQDKRDMCQRMPHLAVPSHRALGTGGLAFSPKSSLLPGHLTAAEQQSRPQKGWDIRHSTFTSSDIQDEGRCRGTPLERDISSNEKLQLAFQPAPNHAAPRWVSSGARSNYSCNEARSCEHE